MAEVQASRCPTATEWIRQPDGANTEVPRRQTGPIRRLGESRLEGECGGKHCDYRHRRSSVDAERRRASSAHAEHRRLFRGRIACTGRAAVSAVGARVEEETHG